MDEAVGWFRGRLKDSASKPTLVFLVGGPGAGKSYAAASAVAELVAVDPPTDGLAHRTYQYQAAGRKLTVVNDATITRATNLGSALTADIDAALDEQRHLLACVNRGVLVEELACLRKDASVTNPGGLLIEWMHGAEPEPLTQGDLRLDPVESHGYIRSASITRGEDVLAEAVVVFVDVCSLLEVRPTVDWASSTSSLSVRSDPYAVSRLTRRTVEHQQKTSAGALFQSVVRRLQDVGGLDGTGDIQFDPVLANIRSLSDLQVRTGLITFLRSAEVASAKRFAFRELWGIVVRSLVGHAPEGLDGGELPSLLQRLQPDPQGSEVAHWEALQVLAGMRFSQGLVGAQLPDGSGDPSVNPITKLLWPLDPVRDARPGRYQPKTWNSGWATPVVDAFSGQIAAGSPLETLLEDLDEEDALHRAVANFDWALDKAFVRASRSSLVTTSTRQEMIAWYGAYLMRLYAISNGISAFRSEVAMWTQAWRDAPNLPDALDRSLTTLLRPKRDPNDPASSVLVPLFDSRTSPIVGAQAEPRLALKTDGVEMTTRRNGDALLLQLSEKSKTVGRVELDFPLIRESLACSMEHIGITEQTSVASPRLERFRAARLAPHLLQGAKYRIVVGAHEYTFTVED
ncbi:hypothetical protein [Phycicoccus sp. Root563]|uniref:hypothetical protein n=1 Tax=Phycicoccus sp. Root563 TaxID=1736562 RepID=UPI0012F9EFD3|nr:hypothetical protein [Phycicoccus sp. Root563]